MTSSIRALLLATTVAIAASACGAENETARGEGHDNPTNTAERNGAGDHPGLGGNGDHQGSDLGAASSKSGNVGPDGAVPGNMGPGGVAGEHGQGATGAGDGTVATGGAAAGGGAAGGAEGGVMQQGNSQEDVRITADIRKALVGDGSLSMAAKNAKVITANGVTTLQGNVDSDAEKAAVEAKAKAVAGVTRVDNQLTVKAK